ncbi:MAG: ribosome-associated translation inhibitor RaiA [Clostridia bacterium]|nr:ribosome-associated translation inhibitor RaiA [Clostridia bacterium]
MKITITGRNMKVGTRLTERIEKKLSKMNKYFKDDVEAQVKLSHENSVRQIVEITLYLDGSILRAEETSNDMYMSIDKAIARLEGQIRRHRTKLEKRLHEDVIEPAEDMPVWDEASDEVVRVKRFEVKPMAVEDAIAQMDMLGHSFFLFVNAETGITSVVYRRNDGKIGMLEPTMA